MSEKKLTVFSPSDVTKLHKEKYVPPQKVLDSFNELLVKNFSLSQATIIQEKDVVLLIYEKMERKIGIEDIYKNKWLDIEDVYRE